MCVASAMRSAKKFNYVNVKSLPRVMRKTKEETYGDESAKLLLLPLVCCCSTTLIITDSICGEIDINRKIVFFLIQ